MENIIFTQLSVPEIRQIFRTEIEAYFDINKQSIISNQQPASDQWLNVQELSEYLPDRPAVATIYEHTANYKIPFHKKSKRLYFLKSEIDEWLHTGRKKTKAERMDEIKADAEKQLEVMRNKTKK